jgi:hypothetical protein
VGKQARREQHREDLPDGQEQQQADQLEGNPSPRHALLPPIGGYGCGPAVAQFNGYLR